MFAEIHLHLPTTVDNSIDDTHMLGDVPRLVSHNALTHTLTVWDKVPKATTLQRVYVLDNAQRVDTCRLIFVLTC